MAKLHRNEGIKLIAGYLNTLAASVLTVGVFTPLAIEIYGSGVLKEIDSLPTMAVICFGSSAFLHLLGQIVLWALQDTP